MRRRFFGNLADHLDQPIKRPGRPQLLHDQIAGKAAGVFDDDGADVVTFDAVEEPCETLATLDRIGPPG